MASETHKKGAESVKTSLKFDPASIASNNDMTGPRDGSTSDAISCISSADGASSIKESEVDQEALLPEQNNYYMNGVYGYYYPGFSGSFGEGNGQTIFGGTEEFDVRCSANQGNAGSVLYYYPWYPSGFTHYSPFFAGTAGHYGEYIGQHMLAPSAMFPQPLMSSGFVSQPVSYSAELVPAFSWDLPSISADGVHEHGFRGDTALLGARNNPSSQNRPCFSLKSPHASKSASLEKKSAFPAGFNALSDSAVQDQTLIPVSKATAPVSKVFLPINKYSSNLDQDKSPVAYSDCPTNIKQTDRTYFGSENLKIKNKTQGLVAADSSIQSPDYAAGNKSSCVPDITVKKDEYNLPDFPTTYNYALFFVIKSYSEDDIHKSIKYNVWSSTPNGNKRLDSAFQIARDKSIEKGGHCPVFLFFSVNASGQFCGVAEMTGQVDFNKSLGFWQQDKWTGYFPVKWHIIKDIPNPQLRHIILENNENKPVTNSRDTQEVKFPQGTEMLSIFKYYRPKTSILDDFAFYDNRQRALQDKKGRTSASKLDHLKLKASEVTKVAKPGDLDGIVSALQSTDLGSMKAQENGSTDSVTIQ